MRNTQIIVVDEEGKDLEASLQAVLETLKGEKSIP